MDVIVERLPLMTYIRDPLCLVPCDDPVFLLCPVIIPRHVSAIPIL